MSDAQEEAQAERDRQKSQALEDALQGFSFFERIRHLFDGLKKTNQHFNRKLDYYEYSIALLFFYFNPILTSLRGIQRASEIPKVRKALGIKRMSLGSLSESVRTFDPEHLKELYLELVERAKPNKLDPKLRPIEQILTAVDGSILPALPRMTWALWLGSKGNGVRLHTQLDVAKGFPTKLDIKEGNSSETQCFKDNLEGDKFYVMDRGFANHRLFEMIVEANSSFVGRVRNNAAFECQEERDLSDEDQSAGVRSDRVGILGSDGRQAGIPIRLVEVYVPGHEQRGLAYPKKKISRKHKHVREEPGQPYTLLLATDRLDLPAEVIALVYRHRWKIETFFKMLKSLLGCRHLLSDSIEGITMQVYSALIAALLLAEFTQVKPNKATLELFQFYILGMADVEDICRHLDKLKKTA